jgi:RNA polymerase sigma-70 factor (ECF subfamily)
VRRPRRGPGGRCQASHRPLRHDRGEAVLDAVGDILVDAHEREWPRLVAGLIRLTGDWDLAEECTQEAFLKAWQRWPGDGIPQRPAAWLAATARNGALDRLRRRSLESAKLAALAALPGTDEAPPRPALGDDQLCLIFTCCHPSLAMEARVALTLRSVAGLTTAEIARAFLVSERTMTQRLFRAKAKIRDAVIPFRIPAGDQLRERLDAVLAVLYLVFNEGYHATSGDGLPRAALCDEATRLARLLAEWMPDEPEVEGLLALMELHDARRGGRTDGHGDLVRLDEQDRSRWDQRRIRAAVARLDATDCTAAGPYRLQASIAACHATAESADATDWSCIAELYAALAELVPGPIIELNRAVAVAMAGRPDAALVMVDALVDARALPDYYLLFATRADVLRRLGRPSEAADAYAQAVVLVTNEADRRLLVRARDSALADRP